MNAVTCQPMAVPQGERPPAERPSVWRPPVAPPDGVGWCGSTSATSSSDGGTTVRRRSCGTMTARAMSARPAHIPRGRRQPHAVSAATGTAAPAAIAAKDACTAE